MDWVPYVLTFVGGSGCGALVTLLVAPKADRDRIALDRKRIEMDETKHVRDRRIRTLETALDEMQSALSVYASNNPKVLWPNFLVVSRVRLGSLTQAIMNVVTDDLTREQRRVLTDVVRSFSVWCLVQVGEAVPESESTSAEDADLFLERHIAGMRLLRNLVDAS